MRLASYDLRMPNVKRVFASEVRPELVIGNSPTLCLLAVVYRLRLRVLILWSRCPVVRMRLLLGSFSGLFFRILRFFLFFRLFLRLLFRLFLRLLLLIARFLRMRWHGHSEEQQQRGRSYYRR